jgi:hypothetical protein
MAIQNLAKAFSSLKASPLWSAPAKLSITLEKLHKSTREMYRRLILYIDHYEDCTPRASTILWSTVLFVAFLIFGGFAVGYPKPWMRVAIVVVNSSIFIALVIFNSRDAIDHSKLNKTQRLSKLIFTNQIGHQKYHRNLVNTSLVFILTVATMTILYERLWYQGLNLWILQTRQERIVTFALPSLQHQIIHADTNISMQPPFRFPAMYIIQDHAHYQANILDEQPWTCFVGAQDKKAPMCSSLTKEEVLSTASCNCNDSWVPRVLPNFLDGNGGDNKRSLSLLPKENLITRANLMTVKFKFNCKSVLS